MAATHFSGPVALGAGSVEHITAAKTLVQASDNGKTFVLTTAGTDGATVTLPALTDGARFTFIVGAAFATTNWIVASAEGDNISGIIVVNGASVPAVEEDQINFVASAETVGDYIELIGDGDGSQWLVNGVGNAAGSITATDPA